MRIFIFLLILSANSFSGSISIYSGEGFSGKQLTIPNGQTLVGDKLNPVGDKKTSSIQIDKDMAAEICMNKEAGKKAPCQILLKSVNKLPKKWEKAVRHVRAFSVNPNYFSYIFASDPQFYWRIEAEGRSSGDKKQDSLLSNQNHIKVMNQLKSDDPNSLLGVVINGDLTAYGKKEQLQDFESYYGLISTNNQNQLNLPVFLGLGNHDYHNNLRPNVLSLTGKGCLNNECIHRMVEYMKNYIDTNPHIVTKDPKSLSYVWSVRDYLFIQMHNYPSYEVEYDHLSLTSFMKNVKIENSFAWLEDVLNNESNKNKKIILNFHDLGDQFSSKKNPEGYEKFKTILDGKRNVKAIFVGHIHKSIGEIKPLKVSDTQNIPVFRCGSASYNLMNLVRFYDDKIVVNPISSADGKLEYLDKEVRVNF